MGKKMRSNSELSNSDPHEVNEGVESRGPCNHCPAPACGAQLDRILSQLRYSGDGAARCEECRISPSKKRGIKEQDKPPKKRAGSRSPAEASSDADFLWVCLDCTRCFCGGAASGSMPSGHARRHAKAECHLWAVRSDSPDTCWCFSCNSLVRITPPQELDALAGSAMDVENAGTALFPDIARGYAVRGLVNLGNTCFFNSVMQNLLAMGILRGFLVRLARPFGALTLELMNLFIQTETSWNSYGSLNPSEVFRCICVSAPQFMGYEQQDSHELLRYLLDGLRTEEIDARRSLGSSNEQDEGASSNEATMVDFIFGGQLSSTVSCVDCGHTSVVHERFLDLSLPVPSKKPSTKNSPLPTPKKNRLPAREGKRSKPRRKRTAKEFPEVESHKTGDSNPPSECNESCAPASDQNDRVEVGEEGNFVGMDYVRSIAILDTADSISQKSEVPVAQCSESGQIYEGENSAPYSSDPQIKVHCPEQIASSDSCGASTYRDDNPSSCTQDSDVLQIPQTELDLTVPETSKINQKTDKAAYFGSALKESNEKTTSVAGCEEIDAYFEGVGDLYNDLEVTSDINRESGMGQEMEMTLLADNIIWLNQDEVDDTSSPVSVGSCLSLFTKPEFLSDDHAWHCDRCSEKSSDEDHRRGKQQADERQDCIGALMSVIDGGEIRNKRISTSLDTDFMNPTDLKVTDNGNVIASSEDFDLHTQMDRDQNAAAEVPQTLPSTIERSVSVTCKYGPGTDVKSLDLSNPRFIGKECPDILQKNEDCAGLCHALQYVKCPSQHEASLLHQKLRKDDSDCCSTGDQSSVGCVQPDLPAVSSNSPNHTETVPQSSCDNDNVSEVNQVGRQYSPLMEKLQPVNDSQGEEVGTESKKVKRKASKQILINRTPPILTIHLKRFNQDTRGRLNKLRGHISFGEILDLRPYMDPRCAEKERCYYHLVGLVEHSGSMTRGHYVAYVRGERSQSKAGKAGDPAWFYASDAHVREVSLSEVLRSDAYILFYEKVWC